MLSFNNKNNSLIRKAAVAGKFYPSNEKELRSLIAQVALAERNNINYSLANNNIIGAVIPHAGYIFSAYQAIHFFELLKQGKEVFDTIVIVNPNHTGYGEEISIDDNTEWESPLGNISVDIEFAALLDLPFSGIAHKYEHSAEVMLPFLRYYLDYEFSIVPICMKKQNVENAKLVANAVYSAMNDSGKKVLFIASSDFSHYEEPDFGRQQDDYVLDEVLKLNTKGVFKQVKKHNVSACGYGPIMSLMEFSKLSNNNPKAHILKRGHSGEVYPSDKVVDYVSILFYDK